MAEKKNNKGRRWEQMRLYFKGSLCHFDSEKNYSFKLFGTGGNQFNRNWTKKGLIGEKNFCTFSAPTV